MINDLLEVLLPERARARDVETFRRGLVRLMAGRATDKDPINDRPSAIAGLDRSSSPPA